MSKHDADASWQAQAEQAERNGAPAGSPEAERYRLIVRALQRPLALQLPADFAANLQQRVVSNERRSVFEDGLVTVLMLVMVIIGLAVAYPYVVPIVAEVRGSLPVADAVLGAADGALSNVPWKTILAASLCIAGVMGMERLLTRAPAAA